MIRRPKIAYTFDSNAAADAEREADFFTEVRDREIILAFFIRREGRIAFEA